MAPLQMRTFALLLVALVGALAFQGCGSDSTNTAGMGSNTPLDGSACNVLFCPVVGPGKACCAAVGVCGLDYGMGCIANTTPDAGP